MEDSVRWLKRIVDLDLLRQAESAWTPRVDVYRTPQGWVIKLDVAGLEPGDIRCTLQGNTVVVRGRRRDTLIEHDWQVYRMEIEYCEFSRTIQLPVDLSGAEVEIFKHHGMLVIAIAPPEEG